MIIFEWIRWKNFLSTGNNWNEVALNKNPTTLIVGANGHGKSTLLDALTFALFGKPFRNINKPNLVNSVNGKNLVAELQFSIGPKKYKVVRGISPALFEVHIDGELVDQDALGIDYQKYLEENILKFNHKAFTQIVILGSKSFVPFMKLKAAERRNIIENLLDIEIFSSMNKIAKESYTKAKDDVVANKTAIDNAKDKIALQQQYVEDAKKSTKEQLHLKTIELIRTEADVEEAKKSKVTAEAEAFVIAGTFADWVSVTDKIRDINTVIPNFIDRKTKEQENLDFYTQHDNCPTCKQVIDKGLKFRSVNDSKDEILKYEDMIRTLERVKAKCLERIQHIENFEKVTYKAKLVEIGTYANTQAFLEKDAIRIKQEMIEIQNKQIVSDEMMDISHKLVEELEQLVAARAALVEDRAYYEAAVSLLKDGGIKAQIIKQYLPVINGLVNKFLTSMDFFVNFELDEEFNETIKSRYRDDFTYDSFSEGEKQKIDIALLFAWRAVAKLKNSMNCNLLIMDEIFDSSLDGTGADLVLSILSTLPEGSNVFVISHRELLHDKFGASIKFEKRNNFSEIVEQEI